MAYTAWNVVFGEQPTAAKWNQLGENDAGFKDGTNIDDLAIVERHMANNSVDPLAIANDCMFSVYISADQSHTTNFDLIEHDTEEYDLGSDFNTTTHRFVAPHDGYYALFHVIQMKGSISRLISTLYINGAEAKRGGDTTNAEGAQGSDLVLLSAGDYVEHYGYFGASTPQIEANTFNTRFSGFLYKRIS